MAEKSIKKNYIYNLIYQIVLLVAPFITTPYISRILQPEGVGLYSYASSIVSYFTLVAVLGTGTFGQRAISYVQKDVEARSRAFWEVFLLRLITSVITLAAYGAFITFFAGENKLIYIILALNIINIVFDISWLFQGVEEFGKIAVRNVIIKILNIVAIYLFVKEIDDLYKYVLIMVGFTVLGSLSLWVSLPKYLCKVKGIKPFREFKTIIEMFIPTIAIQVYTILDKSMIGWFSDGYAENGYYEQAEKIAKMTLTVVTSLGTVMIPRISRVFKEGDMEQVKYYLYKSYRFVWMLAIPIMFGLISISNIFIPIFLGDGYEKCILLLDIFSLLVVFIGLSNVTGMQYLVPVGKQNILTITVTVGAVINFLLNIILIKFYSSLGACIASVIAEFCVTFVGFAYIKKKKCFELAPIFKSSIKYWIAGIIMFVSLFVIRMFLPVAIWSLIVLIFGGIIIYFAILLILHDKLLFEILNRGVGIIKNILHKN
jgi:O-antigen/teichoic acid export membrane protein